MIDVKCPYCGVESEADDYLKGRSVRCPDCRKVYILHSHSTEIPLDPIIPGVPAKQAGEKPSAAPSVPAAPPEAMEKEPPGPHLTLKRKARRRTILPGPALSPLVDEVPAAEGSESAVRRVEIVGLDIPFRDLFRATVGVAATVLLCGLAVGAVAWILVRVVALLAAGR